MITKATIYQAQLIEAQLIEAQNSKSVRSHVILNIDKTDHEKEIQELQSRYLIPTFNCTLSEIEIDIEDGAITKLEYKNGN